MRITIVIPTYNEAENLPKLVSALFTLPLDLWILVVDDNSPDGTGAIADNLAKKDSRVRVIHRAIKEGLRSAYLTGFRIALDDGADAVAQMDADFSHDPAKLVELASRLENCDLVIGSRYVEGGAVDEHWPLWRKGLSAFGNFYSRAILRLPQRDVTAGFRLWSAERWKECHCNACIPMDMSFKSRWLIWRIASITRLTKSLFIFLIGKRENRRCLSRF